MSKPKPNMETAKRIGAARAARHLSYAEIATALGIKPEAVRRWEIGKAAPSHATRVALARLLDVSDHWLTTGSDLTPPRPTAKHPD